MHSPFSSVANHLTWEKSLGLASRHQVILGAVPDIRLVDDLSGPKPATFGKDAN